MAGGGVGVEGRGVDITGTVTGGGRGVAFVTVVDSETLMLGIDEGVLLFEKNNEVFETLGLLLPATG